MTENKVALKNMTEEELKEFLKSIGEKPFRGTQIFSWIYKGAKIEAGRIRTGASGFFMS